jgi:nitric oxide reductase subunit B
MSRRWIRCWRNSARSPKVSAYFLVVAGVLLLEIAAGALMAHAYYDRRSFYGIALANVLPFNFLRDVHI